MSNTAKGHEQSPVDTSLPSLSDGMETLIPYPPRNPPSARRYPRKNLDSLSEHSSIMKLPPVATMNTGINTRLSPMISSHAKSQSVTSAVGVVLYIDDDKIQRKVMTKILGACNVIAIITATDGSKGLAAMQKNEFDLVISDLDMPIMDGREMIQAFRAWEKDRPRRQRVVCLTESDKDRDSDEALLKAGFDEVLRKPVKRNDIKALLHRV